MELICGLNICPCDKDPKCKRNGNCEWCIERHKTHETKPQPWCLRPENAEKIEALKKAQNK